MEQEWWYSTAGERKGPVSAEALRQLLLEGKVPPSTLVWKEGLANWQPLSEVQDLQQVVKSIPPELPKPTNRDVLVALPLAGPWRRFFARIIDLWAISIPSAFLVSATFTSLYPAFGLWVSRPGSEYAFGWLLMPLILLIEAGIVAMFGNSLGKAVLGLAVTTVGGQRPTATQYLRRQLGVYWFGLGTGFPLVSMFTMARQHGHLKAGRNARYDEGKFNVKVRKIGVVRAIAALLVIGATLSANIGLQILAKSNEHSYYSESTWVNEATGKTVHVPSGWIHQDKTKGDQQAIDIFAGPDFGVYLVFAMENAPPEMDLDRYRDIWVSAVKGTMKFSGPGERTMVGSLEAVTLTGTTAEDQTQRIQATLVKTGNQMWRVVILANSNKSPSTEHPLKLQALLFQSIE